MPVSSVELELRAAACIYPKSSLIISFCLVIAVPGASFPWFCGLFSGPWPTAAEKRIHKVTPWVFRFSVLWGSRRVLNKQWVGL